VNSLKRTSHHLSVCSANFRRLKKLLNNFDESSFNFAIDEGQSMANFKIIDQQRHTLLLETKQLTANKILSFKFRIQIFLDAKLAEVVSFQNEQPVPFFVIKPRSQSLDEKFQQNQMLTEWLELIFLRGMVGNALLP
jgi:uncharacterized protein YqiB (DUF1249 family)